MHKVTRALRNEEIARGPIHAEATRSQNLGSFSNSNPVDARFTRSFELETRVDRVKVLPDGQKARVLRE